MEYARDSERRRCDGSRVPVLLSTAFGVAKSYPEFTDPIPSIWIQEIPMGRDVVCTWGYRVQIRGTSGILLANAAERRPLRYPE
jgi:hypothetical protein